MLSTTNHDGPTFHTRSRTAQCNITEDLTLQPNTNTVTPDITTVTDTPDATPKALTDDRLQALLQMQRTVPFCKCISKHLSNRKRQNMKLISFYTSRDYCINMSQIQTKHSWPMEIQSACGSTWQLGHQGATHTYCLIKHPYYLKDINKDIREYIANCTLCCRGKS